MTRRTGPRMGFTLVELLIVIAIIAVLMALLLPAISKVRVAAERTDAQTEMSQLTAACTNFKQKFGFMPPQTFTVPTAMTPTTDPSYLILQKMYPRWDVSQGVPDAFEPVAGTPYTDLKGTQVLVYFLGGPKLTGWKISGPQDAAGANSAHGPFYDFKTDMLAGGFLLDPWETPYAYFSTGKSGKYPTGTTAASEQNANLYPFMAAANKPMNPGMIQIVSAGPDIEFGTNGATGIWTAGSGSWSPDSLGGDDMSNFHEGVMGAE